MATIAPIPEDRPLTSEELILVRWLLEHGNIQAPTYFDQLAHARVVSRCSCGCASIDFAIDGVIPSSGAPLEVLSDYQWTSDTGALFGVFVFAKAGELAGLEVWSIDGAATARELPKVNQLQPLRLTRSAIQSTDRSSK